MFLNFINCFINQNKCASGNGIPMELVNVFPLSSFNLLGVEEMQFKRHPTCGVCFYAPGLFHFLIYEVKLK